MKSSQCDAHAHSPEAPPADPRAAILFHCPARPRGDPTYARGEQPMGGSAINIDVNFMWINFDIWII